jgi:hypothetical protein
MELKRSAIRPSKTRAGDAVILVQRVTLKSIRYFTKMVRKFGSASITNTKLPSDLVLFFSRESSPLTKMVFGDVFYDSIQN